MEGEGRLEKKDPSISKLQGWEEKRQREGNKRYPIAQVDTEDCSRDGKRDRSNRLVKKDRDRLQRGKQWIGVGRLVRNFFLKAEDHGSIRTSELIEILLVGTKTMKVPLKNRHDQKGTRLGVRVDEIGTSARGKEQESVSIGSEGKRGSRTD